MLLLSLPSPAVPDTIYLLKKGVIPLFDPEARRFLFNRLRGEDIVLRGHRAGVVLVVLDSWKGVSCWIRTSTSVLVASVTF